jgi:emp24/gp25L/p24 family/GOLD
MDSQSRHVISNYLIYMHNNNNSNQQHFNLSYLYFPCIIFFIRIHAVSKTRNDEIAKLEHLGPVVDSVIKISDDLDSLERLQHHARIRDQLHRDIAETTKSRVQWLAIFQGALMAALSVFQLRHVRDWFKESDKAGRV